MSLHAVFDALDITLSEIDDWNCCGGAAAHCLSNLLGLALPARNIAKAQARDLPLVVPCPGCFNAVKRAQYALTHDPDMRKTLEEVVGFQYRGDLRVRALHEIVVDHVGLDRVRGLVRKPLAGLKVVSYYGCALVRSPGVVEMGDHENPLFLDAIVDALGGEALDWSFKTDCCGSDLAMTHGRIAGDIAGRFADMAREAGADCIMASCGLCQINLDMKQPGPAGNRVPVFYFTELMGTAMDLAGRDAWWAKHIVDVRPLLKARNLT